jgi:carboxypeptidase C (cathepsin A)
MQGPNLPTGILEHGEMNMRHVLRMVAATLSIASTGIAWAQGEVAVTKHSVKLDDGRTLAYTAQVGQLPIRPMGFAEPHAYIGYVSYRVEPAAGTRRPIIFMWSGGPSGASIGENTTYGPKTIADGKLVDNPLTILSVGDLVFVDPVGTGFSRPTKPEYGAEFYQVLGDQASVAEFIRVWRNYYDPEKSPIFLYGGSYGTWRVSGVAEVLERNGIHVTGAVLKAGGIQLGAEALPAVYRTALQVPGRAATALHHHVLSADAGTNLEQVFAAASKWALETYVPALLKIDSLPDTERERIAQQLSRYTGFAADKIDRKSLVIQRPEYLSGLLPGRVLDGNDMRNSSPAASGGGRGGRGDAAGGGRAMGVSGAAGRGRGGRGGTAADDDPNRITPVDYIRRVLNYRTDLAYLPNERAYVTVGTTYALPGSAWTYNHVTTLTPEMRAIQLVEGGPVGTAPWLRNAMELNLRLRVLVAAGYYDSQNSCAGNEEMIRRQDPQIGSRFTLKCYLSGHVIQSEPIAAPLFFADFRRWVSATIAAR